MRSNHFDYMDEQELAINLKAIHAYRVKHPKMSTGYSLRHEREVLKLRAKKLNEWLGNASNCLGFEDVGCVML